MSMFVRSGLGYDQRPLSGCDTDPYHQNSCCTTPFGPSLPDLTMSTTVSVMTPFTQQQKAQMVTNSRMQISNAAINAGNRPVMQQKSIPKVAEGVL